LVWRHVLNEASCMGWSFSYGDNTAHRVEVIRNLSREGPQEKEVNIFTV